MARQKNSFKNWGVWRWLAVSAGSAAVVAAVGAELAGIRQPGFGPLQLVTAFLGLTTAALAFRGFEIQIQYFRNWRESRRLVLAAGTSILAASLLADLARAGDPGFGWLQAIGVLVGLAVCGSAYLYKGLDRLQKTDWTLPRWSYFLAGTGMACAAVSIDLFGIGRFGFGPLQAMGVLVGLLIAGSAYLGSVHGNPNIRDLNTFRRILFVTGITAATLAVAADLFKLGSPGFGPLQAMVAFLGLSATAIAYFGYLMAKPDFRGWPGLRRNLFAAGILVVIFAGAIDLIGLGRPGFGSLQASLMLFGLAAAVLAYGGFGFRVISSQPARLEGPWHLPLESLCKPNLTRPINTILLLLFVVASLLVLQKSFGFLTTMPMQNIDDSIPNVSVSLVENGRYGFMASPLQGWHHVDRSHAFFNYGPIYFYIAAALSWFFGPSFMLFRALHPIGLVTVVFIALVTFRRYSLAGVGMLATGTYLIYLQSHWPLARPDIVVSLSVALMLLSVSRAILNQGRLAWFATGIFASTAASTHFIAFSVVPAAGLIWLAGLPWVRAEPGEPSFRKRSVQSFVSIVAGGVAGGLIFLLAIDFRIGDVIALVSKGAEMHGQGYAQNVRAHFNFAWSSLGAGWSYLLFGGIAVAVGLSVLGQFFTPARRRLVISLVTPPVVLSVAYHLSLGIYASQHSGYLILAQVLVVWTLAAVVTALVAIATQVTDKGGLLLNHALTLVAIAVLCVHIFSWATTPSNWESAMAGNVDFSEYVEKVISPLPERASVAGSLVFGLESGDRIDLVQFYEFLTVAELHHTPETTPQITPDFIALSYYELDTEFARYAGNLGPYLDRMQRFLPHAKFELIHLVNAPPYGTARVYRRTDDSALTERNGLPSISVNDGSGRQWSSRLSPPKRVRFTPAAPVTADISLYQVKASVRAMNSVVAELPAGIYLIQVALEIHPKEGIPFVLATPGPYFLWRGGWTKFPLPATPFLHGEKDTFILLDHLGGPLYLSRFQTGPSKQAQTTGQVQSVGQGLSAAGEQNTKHAKIKVISVRTITRSENNRERMADSVPPPLEDWITRAKDTIVQPRQGGTLRLSSPRNPNSVILESPPIAVEQLQRYSLIVPTQPLQGGVEVGVLAVGGGWLSPPTLMPRRIIFHTRAETQIKIALTNPSANFRSRTVVLVRQPILKTLAPKEQFVDRFMGCSSPYLDDPDMICKP